MSDILIENLPEHGIVQDNDLLIIEGQTTDKITVNKLLAKNFGSFAEVEDTATASKAYAVGEYLVLSGQFYKVTAAIAQGNALTVGGNIEATNVGAEVASLNKDLAKISYRVVAVSGSGNYGQQLYSLYNAFNALSLEEKLHAALLRRNVVFYRLAQTDGHFSFFVIVSGHTYIDSIAVHYGTWFRSDNGVIQELTTEAASAGEFSLVIV